jgi:hypothetical protein
MLLALALVGVFYYLVFNLNLFIMGWHKNLTEKTLKSLGISIYWALWFAFVKGCIIGGAIVYCCL